MAVNCDIYILYCLIICAHTDSLLTRQPLTKQYYIMEWVIFFVLFVLLVFTGFGLYICSGKWATE